MLFSQCSKLRWCNSIFKKIQFKEVWCLQVIVDQFPQWILCNVLNKYLVFILQFVNQVKLFSFFLRLFSFVYFVYIRYMWVLDLLLLVTAILFCCTYQYLSIYAVYRAAANSFCYVMTVYSIPLGCVAVLSQRNAHLYVLVMCKILFVLNVC